MGRQRVDEQAATYAARGWQVFPVWSPAGAGRCGCGDLECADIGKHPIARLAPHGFHDATSSAAAVAGWWRARPDANVGVRTGTESGLAVLDVDGEDGAKSLRELVAQHGRFDAMWARTGSGWHAYMAHPDVEVRNSTARIGPGLDVRGDGGYVVAPPSLHASGARYRWINVADAANRQLSPMPDWLVELARPAPQPAVQPVQLRSGIELSYAAAAIEREALDVAQAPPGRRNEQLNRAAFKLGQLVGAGLVGEATVTEALVVAGLSAGPGERKIRSTVRSGVHAGMRHPREVHVDAPEPSPGTREGEREAEAC